MSMFGANPDELHALGTTLKQQIGAVDSIIRAVDGPVGSIAWTGPARERFLEEWNGNFKSALTRLNEAFEAAGNDCVARAEGLRHVMGTG
ncbi:MAG: hypothetical protein AAFP84_00115 [Actinomycetota bacterium]